MATWQTLRDFARGIVRIGSMEPEDIKRGELWFDESDPRYAAKDPHSYDAHEYGKHPEFQSVSAETTTTEALEAEVLDTEEREWWRYVGTYSTSSGSSFSWSLDDPIGTGEEILLEVARLDTDGPAEVRLKSDQISDGDYWYKMTDSDTPEDGSDYWLIHDASDSQREFNGDIIIRKGDGRPTLRPDVSTGRSPDPVIDRGGISDFRPSLEDFEFEIDGDEMRELEMKVFRRSVNGNV